MAKTLFVVAFGHESRVGKDTAGKFLDSALRLAGIHSKKISFAAKLKDISHQLYSWAGLKPGIFYESEEGAKLRNVKLPDLGLTPVEIWVQVGNKMREIYEHTWVMQALRTVPPNVDCLIITDLRFPNEVTKVREMNGRCFKVFNPNVEKRMDNPADRALDGYTGWDDILMNDSDLGMFNSTIDLLAERIIEEWQAQ